MNMRRPGFAALMMMATSLVAGGMSAGIEEAYEEVKRRDADDAARQRIEKAEAKRARKRAKRLADLHTKGKTHE